MNKRTKEVYQFDNVFGPDLSTEQIFDKHVKDIVQAAMGGINQTVFAYGQTSSGKTFTM
jgi:centromeric protein E